MNPHFTELRSTKFFKIRINRPGLEFRLLLISIIRAQRLRYPNSDFPIGFPIEVPIDSVLRSFILVSSRLLQRFAIGLVSSDKFGTSEFYMYIFKVCNNKIFTNIIGRIYKQKFFLGLLQIIKKTVVIRIVRWIPHIDFFIYQDRIITQVGLIKKCSLSMTIKEDICI